MDVQSNQTNKWYQTTLGIIFIVIFVLSILSGIVYLVYLKFFQKEGLQESTDNDAEALQESTYNDAEGLQESSQDNDAEQRLINRLNQKMAHKGYRCYAKSRVAGSLSGPRHLANGDCTRRTCSCKKIDCGARNNVKTQVLDLLSENQITQDQADRFITNLDLNHSNCM